MKIQKCNHIWQEHHYKESPMHYVDCKACGIKWLETSFGKFDNRLRGFVNCILTIVLIPIMIIIGIFLFPLTKFLDWYEGSPVISR